VDRADYPLPERLEGDGLLLRRWHVADAEALGRAVTESEDHLRPWMGWMAGEPQTLEERRAMLAEREHEWRAGGDVMLGIFVEGTVAGSCGLHRRLGPSALERLATGFIARSLAAGWRRPPRDSSRKRRFRVPRLRTSRSTPTRRTRRAPASLGDSAIGWLAKDRMNATDPLTSESNASGGWTATSGNAAGAMPEQLLLIDDSGTHGGTWEGAGSLPPSPD